MVFPTIVMNVTNQNQEMTNFNYKKYSLEKLEEWIHDALSSAEASPHEIYSTIRKAVQEEYSIHRNYADRCFGLLELLSGHRPVDFDYEDGGIVGALGDDVITFNFDPAGNDVSDMVQNPNKWILPVEIDGASGEYYLQLPDDLLDTLGWKEGDTLEYIDNGDGSFSVKKS